MASKRIRLTLGIAAAIIAAPCVSLAVMSSMSQRPTKSEAQRKQLAPCPDSPNCVSTLAPATDVEHAIEPLPFTSKPEAAMAALRRVVERDRLAKIISADDQTLNAKYRSRIFRFVDDVDFVLDESESVIHFRSASRVGYSDMGANRKRMERIRKAFQAELGAGSQ